MTWSEPPRVATGEGDEPRERHGKTTPDSGPVPVAVLGGRRPPPFLSLGGANVVHRSTPVVLHALKMGPGRRRVYG